MKIAHSFLISAVLLLAPFGGETVAIQVSQTLDKNEIDFEDSARFEIKIEWDGGQSAYRFERALNEFRAHYRDLSEEVPA